MRATVADELVHEDLVYKTSYQPAVGYVVELGVHCVPDEYITQLHVTFKTRATTRAAMNSRPTHVTHGD